MSTAALSAKSSPPDAPSDDLEQLAARVDQTIADLQSLDPETRGKALALKSAIEAFHKAGLTHIVRTLKNDPQGKELLFQLVDEPAVYALLAMHGIVRADLRTQVSRIIDSVRPYMQSHGGDVSLVDVREKIVYVRLSGNCNGCSMSSVTLRNTVEETLRDRLPEILGVEVVPNEPQRGLVQLQLAQQIDREHGWIAGPLLAEIDENRPFAFENGEEKILLIKSSRGLRAYRNACAHQGLPLEGSIWDAAADTLTCPWHGFQFDAESGECFSAPQCQLEPFPLRIESGRVFVRPS